MSKSRKRIRVIFVDDEANVLASIKRILRSKRNEWEMAFVGSGKEALALFEEEPFDVIVSDILMPNMDGAELLDRVKKDYHKTIRIALSGQVGLSEVVRSIRSVHQYLSKPCESSALVDKIEGALKSRDILGDAVMQELVTEIESLPVLPNVFKSIEDELALPEPSIKKIAELISMDVGLVAKIIKLINSPYFGLPQHVESIFQAITLLGLDTINALIVGTHLFSMYDFDSLSDFSLTMLWEHSFRVSNIARMIAEYEGLTRDEVVRARMAGLLHDVGKLVLANSFPKRYNGVIELVTREDISVYKAEMEVFGTTHAQVGAYLMGLWGMSGDVVYGIGYHHTYAKKDMSTPMIVSVANMIDHQCIIIHENYRRVMVSKDILSEGGVEKLEEWVAHIADNWSGITEFNVLDKGLINLLRQ
ncbi:response regulator [Maridesulfovibrio sp.]|uniref:response regulator n=1 Tax=Maridesulfovibrio sp. TaxID=2795000 RepID=UPI0029C9B567|nr:response regulator [Maridesulfovibrio sp.]